MLTLLCKATRLARGWTAIVVYSFGQLLGALGAILATVAMWIAPDDYDR